MGSGEEVGSVKEVLHLFYYLCIFRHLSSVQEVLHLSYHLFSGTCPGGRRRRTTCRCFLEPPGDEEGEEVFVSVSIASGLAVSSQTR